MDNEKPLMVTLFVISTRGMLVQLLVSSEYSTRRIDWTGDYP